EQDEALGNFAKGWQVDLQGGNVSDPIGWRDESDILRLEGCEKDNTGMNACVTAAVMNPRMLAISGPLMGSEFPLNSGELVIGREPSNAIWLEHSSVSRRHCVVRVGDGRCVIRDLDSLKERS